MAKEYVSVARVGEEIDPSISSGANHLALPAAVKVAEAHFSVTSSTSLDIPKSDMHASPCVHLSPRALETLQR